MSVRTLLVARSSGRALSAVVAWWLALAGCSLGNPPGGLLAGDGAVDGDSLEITVDSGGLERPEDTGPRLDTGLDTGFDAGFDTGFDTGVDVPTCGEEGLRCCGFGALACRSGLACVGELCRRCVDGETLCGQACVTVNDNLANCGRCGNACPARANAMTTCAAGVCGYVCLPGYLDCDGSPVTGCEVAGATSSVHCGTCNNPCPSPRACLAGVCGCTGGRTYCPRAPSAPGCTDVASDTRNCGMCGNLCSGRANIAGFACTAGTCTFTCATAYRDCDSNPLNGCEVNVTTDRSHCGACGNACPAAQSCVSGACVCPTGQTLCGGACVNLQTDLANCGACGNACQARPNTTTTTCTAGACVFTCQPPFRDCNGLASDGCEVNLANDPAHCAVCGRACASRPNTATTACSGGNCGFTCAAGYQDCNGTEPDGCESLLASDPRHCGSCAVSCTGNQVCVEGGCRCPTTATVCGSTCCGSSQTCTKGSTCTCASGAVCGTDCCGPGEGCTNGVCCPTGRTGCGTACCSSTQTCSSGLCCPTGMVNCGGSCVDLGTNESHCGGCGIACPTPRLCRSGSCQTG